jgi:hypothetical protein
MTKRPPKEKSNLGTALSYTAVAGLLRALCNVRTTPNRPLKFDEPIGARGPVGHYSTEAMIELAVRLERIAANGAKARIAVTPETANLWARALRAYAARPGYDEVLEAVCAKDNCPIRATCYGCRGKANLIIQVFEGRAGFSRALKRER